MSAKGKPLSHHSLDLDSKNPRAFLSEMESLFLLARAQ